MSEPLNFDDAMTSMREACLRAYRTIIQPGMTASHSRKADGSLVTHADIAADAVFKQVLGEHFPQVPLVSEEGANSLSATGPAFVVDPIDGTEFFARGLPNWSISAGLVIDDACVAGVVVSGIDGLCTEALQGRGCFRNGRRLNVSSPRSANDHMYCVIAKGIPPSLDAVSRFATAFWSVEPRFLTPALALSQVAAGLIDGAFFDSMASWDVAAGAVLVREAGGVVRGIDGGPFHIRSGQVVAGSTWAVESLTSRWRQVLGATKGAGPIS